MSSHHQSKAVSWATHEQHMAQKDGPASSRASRMQTMPPPCAVASFYLVWPPEVLT